MKLVVAGCTDRDEVSFITAKVVGTGLVDEMVAGGSWLIAESATGMIFKDFGCGFFNAFFLQLLER